VGRLTTENDLLEKAVDFTARRRKESSLPLTGRNLAAPTEGHARYGYPQVTWPLKR
jgi:hypothetical protein